LRILYLAHRIPYPPDKGDKIRSFHEIKHFSRRHEIQVLAFGDDGRDAEYSEALGKYCQTVTVIPLHPRYQRVRALASMLVGNPWTIGYFSSPQMESAVRKALSSTHFDVIFVFSSSMAPYVAGVDDIPKILDFVDSDACKWLQYAQFKPAPASWLYSYEGKKLGRFEKEMVEAFDVSTFVSSREARYLSGGNSKPKIRFVQNGIDIEYFSVPRAQQPANTIIFTGAMDYFPNIDAVSFFARDVLPIVRRAFPDAQFLIVGSRPAGAVQRLSALPGVQVTGAVPDVRPFLAKSKVAVVPIRISQGIQNKMLEALAAGLPVVTTPAAAEGLKLTSNLPVAIAEDAATFADRVIEFMRRPATASQIAACRHNLKQDYDWDTNLSTFDTLLEVSISKAGTDPGAARILRPAVSPPVNQH